jgi:hypothetical protein
VHTDEIICRGNSAMTGNLRRVTIKNIRKEDRLRRAIMNAGTAIFPIS